LGIPGALVDSPKEEAAFLAKQLQTLKAAAQILGELGISCPAELFAPLDRRSSEFPRDNNG